MDLDEGEDCSLAPELVVPKVDPVLDGVPGLSGVGGLFSDAHQLEGGDVEHLLDGSCVVAPLYHVQGYALAYLVDHCV